MRAIQAIAANGGVIGIGLFTRRFMQSVADFLAAGRSAGPPLTGFE